MERWLFRQKPAPLDERDGELREKGVEADKEGCRRAPGDLQISGPTPRWPWSLALLLSGIPDLGPVPA